MPRKLYLIDTIFDDIDSEEKAYWLGFIYADGNIANAEHIKEKTGKAKYRIEVSLKSDDISHLQKLKEFLKWEGVVKISKTNFIRCDRCRLYFNSKHMWNTLNSYGCTPRKSLTLTFPNIKIFKDKILIRDFIRGYIDGDGCITYNNKDRSKMGLKVLGTENFLKNLQKNLPLEKCNKLATKKGSTVKELAFNTYRGYYVTNYLYKDSNIYLERKYNRYKEYCRLYEES